MVRLVDEDDAADALAEPGLHPRAGLAGVHDLAEGDLDDLVGGQEPERVEEPGGDAGDRGLARARGALEDHVHGGLRDRAALAQVGPAAPGEGGQAVHIGLDVLQADERVEVAEDGVHPVRVRLGQPQERVRGHDPGVPGRGGGPPEGAVQVGARGQVGCDAPGVADGQIVAQRDPYQGGLDLLRPRGRQPEGLHGAVPQGEGLELVAGVEQDEQEAGARPGALDQHPHGPLEVAQGLGAGLLALLRQALDDGDDAAALRVAECGGQAGELVEVALAVGARAGCLRSTPGGLAGLFGLFCLAGRLGLRWAGRLGRLSRLGRVSLAAVVGARGAGGIVAVGRPASGLEQVQEGGGIVVGAEIALGGEGHGDDVGVLLPRPVPDGLRQREAAEVGVVEEDVVRVRRQTPHGLHGIELATVEEAVSS